jgi:hypothetical protein
MKEVDYKGVKYTIKTEPFTLGDMAKLVAYTDALVSFSQLYIDKDARVSPSREEFMYSIAKSCVIIQRGLSVGETILNKATISHLMDQDEGFVKFILKEYIESSEPPLVKDEEDAKKK